MNRLTELFQSDKRDLLSIYFTAGFPLLEDTISIAEAVEKAGADLIEIGMPYSDPIADGPTIQMANDQALANGMTIRKLFEQLADLRKKVSIPVLLMGYFNPVYQFGVDAFCRKCSEVGVDGLIIPDMPLWEYETQWQSVLESHGLFNIFLVTPQTPENRIRQIDSLSKAFIYLVSSASVTGSRSEISTDQEAYFKRIVAMKLQNPGLIGFGISNQETFQQASKHGRGAIIGSAFIQVLKDLPVRSDLNRMEPISCFIESIK